MTHLVFFCGHAGTGKTTLAKKLIGPLMQASSSPFCLLDKDTLFGGYSAAAMSMLTGDPNDRDSPLFLQHLRDPRGAEEALLELGHAGRKPARAGDHRPQSGARSIGGTSDEIKQRSI